MAPVRRRSDFAALSRSRARGRSGPVWVAWISERDEAEEPVRIAYAVPRAAGGSVIRNRIRRRLRPMMAEQAEAGLPPGAYLVGVRGGSVEVPAHELRRHLDVALHGATRSGRQ